MSICEGLNTEQRKAVEHSGSPLLIVAGAGTGKTTVLTRRIAYHITEHNLKPQQIIAVTFTEKAATELSDRVEQFVPYAGHDMWIGTFHALCERILREHGHDIGLPIGFQVLSESQTWLLLRKHFDSFSLKYYRPRGNQTKFIQALLTHFSRCKDELITPQQYYDAVEEVVLNNDTAQELPAEELKRLRELAHAYARYQKLLLQENAVDFGDILSYVYELFTTRPHILQQYQQQFSHVFVDEFQDTNHAQYHIIKLLCQGDDAPEITVVGDDNQSIYGFRGATVDNILQFSDDFSSSTQIVLTQNYRSVQQILDLSYTLIANNNPETLESRLGISKQLVSSITEEGRIQAVQASDEHIENQEIATHINQLHDSGVSWNSIAILVRAHGHAELIAQALSQSGIPVLAQHTRHVFHHPIVLSIMAMIRALINAHNNTAVLHLLQQPPLSLGHSDHAAVMQYARKKGSSLYTVLQYIPEMHVSIDGRQNIQQFLALMEKMHSIAKEHSIQEVILQWVEHTQAHVTFANRDDKPFEALEQFLIIVQGYERNHPEGLLAEFVQFYDDSVVAGEDRVRSSSAHGVDAVQIMTMHSAKGLEFDYVVIPQLVTQRFPTARRSQPIPLPACVYTPKTDEKEEHLREERRLCYVALTRAKKDLLLTCAKQYGEGSVRERKPSRFVQEMNLIPRQVSGDNAQLSAQSAAEPVYVQEQHTPRRMSFSQVQTFQRCPLQFKYRYVLKVPSTGNHALSFGSTIHNTLQAWHAQLKTHDGQQQQGLFEVSAKPVANPKLEDLLSLYEQKWIDDWYQDDHQKQSYKKHGKEILTAYFETHAPFVKHPVAVEQSFRVRIGNCTFSGRIDRIDSNDDGITIIDYKTGNPKTRLDKADKQQLWLYQLAVQKDLQLQHLGQVTGLEYWYLDNGTVQPVTTDAETVLAFEEEFTALVDTILASDYSPKPSQMVCRTCEFNTICPHRTL